MKRLASAVARAAVAQCESPVAANAATQARDVRERRLEVDMGVERVPNGVGGRSVVAPVGAAGEGLPVGFDVDVVPFFQHRFGSNQRAIV